MKRNVIFVNAYLYQTKYFKSEQIKVRIRAKHNIKRNELLIGKILIFVLTFFIVNILLTIQDTNMIQKTL
jgi:hypothetical protein